MNVINTKLIGSNKNPLAYSTTDYVNVIEAVEDFFEDASIEVDSTEVERIAKELEQNGFAYFNQFLFTI